VGQAEKEGLRVGREGQVEEIGEAEEEGTCTGSGSKGLFRFTLDERAECRERLQRSLPPLFAKTLFLVRCIVTH